MTHANETVEMGEFKMCDSFTERQMREATVQLIFNWINLGYTREQIVRMTIAQGFGENYAISVTDDAFARLAEDYNGIC